MHAYERCIDFRRRLSVAKNAPGYQTVRQLNLEVTIFHISQAEFGIASDAKEVSGVELHFGAATGCHRDLIARHQRRIHGGRYPVVRIAAANGGIAGQDSETGYGAAGFIDWSWIALGWVALRRIALRRIWLLRARLRKERSRKG